ncbi:hypothetical protein BDQ12DRAFT_725001 [Crucibulum laeve]|uniref:Uncharacterized protein n=1 Tax=Crucibulum laeve TaxID=68775 RepID=A0A5C3LUP0_9AGAR|nr:hypothetical protein BDQ12DRAFT_725001 [Crucibulum laeve]
MWFSFLARLPQPPQKKHPTQPLPPSSAAVPLLLAATLRTSPDTAPTHSPTSPCGPLRSSLDPSHRLSHPSLARIVCQSSVKGCRPSISHTRAFSGSFNHLVEMPRTVTPSVKDFDLMALEYTFVFLHLPETPLDPLSLLPTLRSRTRLQNPFPSPLPLPTRTSPSLPSLPRPQLTNTPSSASASSPSSTHAPHPTPAPYPLLPHQECRPEEL